MINSYVTILSTQLVFQQVHEGWPWHHCAIVLQTFRSKTCPAIRTMINVVIVVVVQSNTHSSMSQNDLLRFNNVRNADHVASSSFSSVYHQSVLVQCETSSSFVFNSSIPITLIYVFCHIPTLSRSIFMYLNHKWRRCSASFIEFVHLTSPSPVIGHFFKATW